MKPSEPKKCHLLVLLLLGASLNVEASSIQHLSIESKSKDKADMGQMSSGRFIFNFGASASYSVQLIENKKKLNVVVDPDTVATLEARLAADGVPQGCRATYRTGIFNLSCDERLISTHHTSTLENPHRFVVDYVTLLDAQKKPKPTATSAELGPKKRRSPSTVKNTKVDQVVETKKIESTEEGFSETLGREILDGPSISSYEGRVLTLGEVVKNRSRAYLRFESLREPIVLTSEIPSFKEWTKIHKGEEKLIELYNLAHFQFQDRKYALTLKTIETIRQIDPLHEFWSELSFMEAETYILMSKDIQALKYFEEGVSRYRAAMMRYPQSPHIELIISRLGQLSLENKNYLGAIDILINGIKLHPQSKHVYQWKLGVSEALFKQNRFSEALQYYRELSRQVANKKIQNDGLFRQGDAFFEAKNYKRAIESYENALGIRALASSGIEFLKIDEKESEKSEKPYPSVLFNLAEAYFWTENFNSSLKTYQRFVKEYPLHPNSALALARIGELLALFKAPKELELGAYMESSLRHPGTLGSDIAELRLASDQIMAEKKGDHRRSQLIVDSITRKYEKDDTMKEFVGLVQAEIMYSQRRYEEVFHHLEKMYLSRTKGPYGDLFKKNIRLSLSLAFREMRRTGQCKKLFSLYDEKKISWLSIDNPYFDQHLEAGLCAIRMGLSQNALEQIDAYSQREQKNRTRRVSWEEVKNIQTITSPEELSFYRGLSEYQLGRIEQAISHFDPITESKKATQLLRDSAALYLILSNLKIQRVERADEALKKMTDISLLQIYPYEVLQALFTLKKLEKYDKALTLVDSFLKALTLPSTQVPAWLTKAEVLWRTDKTDEAAEIYASVLDLDPKAFSFEVKNSDIVRLEPLGESAEDVNERLMNLHNQLRSRGSDPSTLSVMQSMSAYRIGLNHMNRNRIDEAIRFFKQAQEVSPDSSWALAAKNEVSSIEFEKNYGDSIQKQLGREPSTKGGNP